jgi:hypothetical protein
LAAFLHFFEQFNQPPLAPHQISSFFQLFAPFSDFFIELDGVRHVLRDAEVLLKAISDGFYIIVALETEAVEGSRKERDCFELRVFAMGQFGSHDLGEEVGRIGDVGEGGEEETVDGQGGEQYADSSGELLVLRL